MALEAARAGILYQQQQQQQQDLYPLLVETPLDNLLLPNFTSIESHCWDLDLLNDCCYGLINSGGHNDTNDCVWDYCDHSNTLSPPPHPDPVLLGSINNGVPTAKISSGSSTDNDDQQIWARGPDKNYSSPECYAPVVVTRPKRRRARARKNQEDIENQRKTHIAVERNRRKQMNDYLAVLRSLMPDSYVQRGDQASIVGGAINFVKELEQNLQWLSAKKHAQGNLENGTVSLPFGEFFTFPQYSTDGGATGGAAAGGDEMKAEVGEHGGVGGCAAVADVEVTMVESHALVKIRSEKPPKQLSKLVMGLQGLRLTILHLNLTKVDEVALYSFSVTVEDESKLNSVDEIAGAVHQLLGRIQEEPNN